MTITINLPAETEERLRLLAAKCGQTIDGYVRQVLEQEVLGVNVGAPSSTPSISARLLSDEALAPFREEVAKSGMTDEEIRAFFEEVREEVHQEKPVDPPQFRL